MYLFVFARGATFRIFERGVPLKKAGTWRIVLRIFQSRLPAHSNARRHADDCSCRFVKLTPRLSLSAVASRALGQVFMLRMPRFALARPMLPTVSTVVSATFRRKR